MESYGFLFVSGLEDAKLGGARLEPWVVDRIKESNAFPQLVDEGREWLNFELGVGRGCSIPIAIVKPSKLELDTMKRLHVGTYNRGWSVERILTAAVEPTLQWLQDEVEKRRAAP